MRLFHKKNKDKLRDVTPKTEAAVRLLSYQTACLQGIGRREDQQDDYETVNSDDVVSIKKQGLFVIVADGMGGMRGGALASRIVVEQMCNCFEKMDAEKDLSIQLEQAVYTANDSVLEELNSAGGSTLVACLVHDEKLWFASVGDSSIFLLRNGRLSRLNREHNLQTREFFETVRIGSMDPLMINSGGNRAALTHYMGMYGLNDVDRLIRPIKLADGDVIMACSDGISGFIPEHEIEACMNCGSPRDICSRLEEEIYRVNIAYQDNYTAVVIRCSY